MIEKADVVIVGGGIFGVSSAFHIAKNTRRSVALLEKNSIGSGSTQRSAAIVRHYYSTDIMIRSSLESRKVYENFKARVGEDLGYVRNAEFILDHGESARSASKIAEDLKKYGLMASLLSAEQIRRAYSYMRVDDDEVGVVDEEAGFVSDPPEAARIYARAAASLGARVYEGVLVRGIRAHSGRVRSVLTSAGEVATSCVINAAGPWGASVGAMVGVELPIQAQRQQLIDLKPKGGPWTMDRPTFSDRKNIIYVKPGDGGLAHVGGHYFGRDCDPDTFDKGVDREFIADITPKLVKRFPELKDAELRAGYSGVYENTPDLYPLVGESKLVKGFIVLAGWSGHGFKHGPFFGRMMAELVETGSTSVDLSMLRPERFAEGRLIQTPYTTKKAPYG